MWTMRLCLLACLIVPVAAHSQEATPSADAVITQELLTEHPWMASLDLANPEIAALLEYRVPGIKYYAPALEALSKLSHEDQKRVALLVGDGEPSEFIDLVHELRVPETLERDILEELSLSDADPDFDIPAFHDGLESIKKLSDIDSEIFDSFQTFCPNTLPNLALFVHSKIAKERLADSEKRLADPEKRLADSEKRLQDLKEISEGQDKILGGIAED